MGVAITELLPTQEIAIKDLAGKILAVDGYNILYQFLTTIRGPDGAPLSDSHGNVTSHLTGLFTRTTHLLGAGIKLIFVFDGQVPDLKRKELDRRRALKEQATVKYEEAKAEGDADEMKKYAARTARLTKEMVEQAKELLDALGVPWVQAPSEGEAQATALVKQGHAWAIVSQDADALLYEAPRIIRHLAVSGKRKLPGRQAWTPIEPELIEHRKVLDELKLSSTQLRALALLIGTDYNIGGVKGIGPKKGLKLVQEYGEDFAALFVAVDWDAKCDVPWRDVLDVFATMPVVDPGKIEFGKVNPDAVHRILVDRHEFSTERIERQLSTLLKSQANTQKGLGDWF